VSASRFAGVFAPLTTPFAADGALALGPHAANVARLCAAGLDGVLVAGSTGEAPLLDPDEQRVLVAATRAAVPSGKHLLVGTGAEATRHAVALCRSAAAEGADAVLVRPPAYFGAVLPESALAAYFAEIADESPIPVLAYNIPKYTHVALPPNFIGRLLSHPNVVGVKDSSGDAANLEAYRRAAPASTVLAGSASLLLRGLELGCDGGIIGVACFAPERCVALLQAHRAGDAARAATIQDALRPLDREIVGRWGPAGVKAAMDAAGLYGGPARGPLTDLADADRGHIARLLAA
jgi:dihydrodipicolinate synthase/N-acetylneuraminate lyase